MTQMPDNTGKKYKTQDKEMIKRLASLMLTYEEIGHVLGMTGEGVKKRYRKIVEQGQAEGKASLRRAQYEVATEKKDVRMLIWLGKQYLGQTDTPQDPENTQILPWEEGE